MSQQNPQAQYHQQNVQPNPIWTSKMVNRPTLADPYDYESQRPPLTPNQIAERHVITKKLPLFYGNPGD